MDKVHDSMATALDGLIPLPERARKPRTVGVTHVVDPGLTRVEAAALMELAGDHVGVSRPGGAAALVAGGVEPELGPSLDPGVAPMLGGTLPELAWRHGRIE